MHIPVGSALGFVQRWLVRQPRLHLRWSGDPNKPYAAGYEHRITFRVDVGNDGGSIARGVVVSAELDGEEVFAADPLDVRHDQATDVEVGVRLARPTECNLDAAGDPVFHGRQFSVVARYRRRLDAHVRIQYPH